MERRYFSLYIGYTMARFKKASGIAREHLVMDVEGDASVAKAMTITVGNVTRVYQLDVGKRWMSQFVDDGAAGVFGPPQSCWVHPQPLAWPDRG